MIKAIFQQYLTVSVFIRPHPMNIKGCEIPTPMEQIRAIIIKKISSPVANRNNFKNGTFGSSFFSLAFFSLSLVPSLSLYVSLSLSSRFLSFSFDPFEPISKIEMSHVTFYVSQDRFLCHIIWTHLKLNRCLNLK